MSATPELWVIEEERRRQRREVALERLAGAASPPAVRGLARRVNRMLERLHWRRRGTVRPRLSTTR